MTYSVSPDRLAVRWPEYRDTPRGRAQRRVLYAVLTLWQRPDTPRVDGMDGARLIDYADVAEAVGALARWQVRDIVRDLAAENGERGPLLDIVETPDKLSVAVAPLYPATSS